MNKQFIFSTLLIFLTLDIFGQVNTPTNMVDAQGKKQGEWVKYYKNGAIQYKGKFKDDHPVDTLVRYYENKVLMSIFVYSEDGKQATARINHPNGYIASEGVYVNQLKEGVWKFYSEEVEGYLMNEENYSENMKNGLSIKYYSTKAVAEKLTYSYGLKDGEWLQYFADGQPFLKASYSAGLLEGKFETWFSNGKPEFIGAYKDNFRDGKWLIYNEDGSLKYEVNYVRGTPDNSQIILDASDELDKMEKGGRTVADPANGLPMFY